MKFLLIYFLFLTQLLVAQVFDIDSLKRVLKTEQRASEKIRIRSLIGEYGGIERTTYWDSIIKDAKQIEYLHGVTYGSFMQSLNYTKKGQYDKAVEFAEQSLSFSKKNRDSVWMGYSIEHLGSLNSYINEKEIALKYYRDALNLYDSKKLAWRKGYVSIRIGEMYELDSNVVESKKMYQQALMNFNLIKDSSGMSVAYNKIGKYYKSSNQLDSSLHYLLLALAVRKNISDEYYFCSLLNDLAFVYLDLGKKEIAYDYILKSQKESDRIGDKGLAFRDINYFLFRYYKSKKDYQLALHYKEVADSLDKVLYNNSNDKAILRQQAKYIYDKEKELDEIENSKLIAIEREEKEKQQLVIYGTCFVLFLVLVFSVFMYNRFKITQKQKKIIEAKEKETQLQKHLIEEKHKEITDSILYAQRIQRALITPEKYIDKQLKKLNKNS